MFKNGILKPYSIIKFNKYSKYVNTSNPNILDVGCGNHSPRIIKHHIPNCIYHGIEKDKMNVDKYDEMAADNLFYFDLEGDELKNLEDSMYDFVIISHVIEHLNNGFDVIKVVKDKMKTKGILYVELPSEKSLFLPSAIGTLNYFDDDTHINFVSFNLIIQWFTELNLIVLESGIKRDIRKIFTVPLHIPNQIYSIVKNRKLSANGLWDLLGFANYFVVIKL